MMGNDDPKAHAAMILYRHTYHKRRAPDGFLPEIPVPALRSLPQNCLFRMEAKMPGTLHFDGVIPTLEQEAPDVPDPKRAVEVLRPPQ